MKKGFFMNSRAPAAIADPAECSSAWPVMIITGNLGYNFNNSLVRVIPSIRGMTMSITAESKESFLSFSKASIPSFAVSQLWPYLDNKEHTRVLTVSRSSTIKTL
jgi:hypothetical protein